MALLLVTSHRFIEEGFHEGMFFRGLLAALPIPDIRLLTTVVRHIGNPEEFPS